MDTINKRGAPIGILLKLIWLGSINKNHDLLLKINLLCANDQFYGEWAKELHYNTFKWSTATLEKSKEWKIRFLFLCSKGKVVLPTPHPTSRTLFVSWIYEWKLWILQQKEAYISNKFRKFSLYPVSIFKEVGRMISVEFIPILVGLGLIFAFVSMSN